MVFCYYAYSWYDQFDFSNCQSEKINDDINLHYLTNFLTDEECDHLIKLSKDKFTRSGYMVNGQRVIVDYRTSYTYDIIIPDEIVKNIRERVSRITGCSVNCIEPMQVVRYEKGQQFKEHCDWYREASRKKTGNQRRYTFFVYLNDIKYNAETKFPLLGLQFNPKKGNALFWQNCETPDVCYEKSLHAGSPPTGDEIKYGLNIWVDFSPVL